ncbi:uncharacterized protein LOC108251960 isoform X2 [Diaphorina citri]|uniref:Uncharacterized protein LOC108251960 isoform X2 n=1 Tax=Diaphorina citri TaxID=121845 RepID=A0A1S4E789_DIACI|nr:uncharacterized protein LOC108251960 isoform X2 [Diaphorina citri]
MDLTVPELILLLDTNVLWKYRLLNSGRRKSRKSKHKHVTPRARDHVRKGTSNKIPKDTEVQLKDGDQSNKHSAPKSQLEKGESDKVPKEQSKGDEQSKNTTE